MDNTILIVDDAALNIEALTDILRCNYKIMAALGGMRAITLLEKRRPDLVLLDINMPDIDGFGVLKHMKASRELSDIPVIFVTGEHDTLLEERGLALGAVDYIRKPFNAEDVCLKVRRHLG